MISTEVLVVGAGPAGTAAAIELRRAGRQVTVIDKAHFPRDKCCGDGLTTDALRLLEHLGLRPDTVQNWNSVTDIVIRNPRGREVKLPLPVGGQFGAVVPRYDLDNRLVELATEAGAQVLTGVGFDSLDQGSDRVVVNTSASVSIEARYLVAADGMWSPVRKAVGVGPDRYRGEWHAFRQYFDHVGPRAQHLTIWFDADLLPGYAWSFPLPGQRANVGFGILRGGTHSIQDMKTLWTDILQRPHVLDVLGPDARPDGRHKAWPIPAHADAMTPAYDRCLFVGDAVAASDPMTGEGIAQALATGMAAARSVSSAGPDRPDLAAHLYAAHLKRHLLPDHRFARLLSKVLRSPLGTRGALRAADLTPWTRRNFARWMFEDYPRAQLLTPSRWQRGTFGAPGPYADNAPATQTGNEADATAMTGSDLQ